MELSADEICENGGMVPGIVGEVQRERAICATHSAWLMLDRTVSAKKKANSISENWSPSPWVNDPYRSAATMRISCWQSAWVRSIIISCGSIGPSSPGWRGDRNNSVYSVRSGCYRDERLSRLAIAPPIKVWRCHAQSAEHAADLLAVFGRMVNDLHHDHPRLHQVPIRRLESSCWSLRAKHACSTANRKPVAVIDRRLYGRIAIRPDADPVALPSAVGRLRSMMDRIFDRLH